MSIERSAANSMSRVRRWPVLLAAALLAQAAGVLTMVTIAARDRNFSVEPNYYEKAVHWDDAARERDHARELGWSVTTAIRDRSLVVNLATALGAPLEGASISGEYFHQAHTREHSNVTLTAVSPGRYECPVGVLRPGFFQVRLQIVRGPERVCVIETVEARSESPR
jgi:nitrogen fixation protein FixH